MLRVIGCLGERHDLGLLALAAGLCLLASLAAFALLARAAGATRRGPRLFWLGLAGAAFGEGAWATHFVGMLAYDPGLPLAFAPWPTLASLAVMVLAAGLGLGLRLGRGAWFGGVVIGLGAGGMHYLGMAALRLPGRLEFDPPLVAASLLAGMALGGAALLVAARPGRPARAVAAALLAGAVLAQHGTGMAAVTLLPDGGVALPGAVLDRNWLAVVVGGSTAAALLAGAAVVAVRARLRAAASQQAAARLRDLAEASFEGIAILAADLRIADSNRRLAEMLGQAATGLPLGALLVRNATPGAATVEALVAEARQRTVTALLATAAGPLPVELRAGLLETEAGPRLVLTLRDLRERLQAEARIEHLAHHDALTGLANRSLLAERLGQALAHARQQGGAVAMLCIDLRRFGPLTDALGQAGGDAVLQAVALRLLRCVQPTDTVARIGGDRFGILRAGAPQPQDATVLARQVLDALAQPLDLPGRAVVVAACIGIAVAPADGDAPDTLLRHAGFALHRAKGGAQPGWRFFEPAVDARMQARRGLELDLRRALEHCAPGFGDSNPPRTEFEVFYQPTLDLRSRALRGFEALVRWRHPERGLIAPADFIPLAEETGLILPLGAWVLRRACAEAAGWPETMTLAVNLSPAQFAGGGLVPMVAEALGMAGLPPERLELEITETAMLQETETTLGILRGLQELGVGIAMDDFGTGYSSLGYLRRFPFDRLKIDRSFIEDLGQREASDAIVRAILALCSSLGIAVTAEGVETVEQAGALERVLDGHGEMLVQGWLFGRPAPAAEIAATWFAPGEAAAPLAVG
ncbi:EAL domain-containing protein [Dankookia rubra]|uniref:EAL domain-containing protein n=1 Tax=Dankookia rubra TaxID=1442381 RepID=A0A4R5Q8Z9_9PROT|nr:EAL domain-containing protein [Dankookia rubra]TDH58607.1 EAL domain-containing protein [Dankookia rubra]